VRDGAAATFLGLAPLSRVPDHPTPSRWSFPPFALNDHRLPSGNPAGWAPPLSGLFRKFTNVFMGPARGRPALVAQICNLLYRRFAIGRAPNLGWRGESVRAQQNAILRYSRFQICATRLPPIRECIYETQH
jgi:hypothetical protein